MKNLVVVIAFLISSSLFAQEWVNYKNEDLKFSVEFPAEPKVQDQEVPTAIGNLTMNMFMVEQAANASAKNLVYMVIHSEYPLDPEEIDTDTAQNMLDGSVDGAVNNVGGKLISNEKITKEGVPGRQAKIEVRGSYLYLNIFLKVNILYAVQTICTEDADGNSDIKKFLNSLKLQD
nr:hypothetical protein [uncultured Psychroserpens sp.]